MDTTVPNAAAAVESDAPTIAANSEKMTARRRRLLQRRAEQEQQRKNNAGTTTSTTGAGAGTSGGDLNLRGDSVRVAAKTDPIRDQAGNMYCVLSVVAPRGARQQAEAVYVKLRGAFPTIEQANAHAAELHKLDPDFDILVTQMYEWVRLPPTHDDTVKTPATYDNQTLNKIMEGYYKGQQEQALRVQERQRAAKKQADELLKRQAKKRGDTNFQPAQVDEAILDGTAPIDQPVRTASLPSEGATSVTLSPEQMEAIRQTIIEHDRKCEQDQ